MGIGFTEIFKYVRFGGHRMFTFGDGGGWVLGRDL